MSDKKDEKSATTEALANRKSGGTLGEILSFMRHSKKWWLTPIIIVLLLIGVLVVLSGTGAAPFIYTLF